MTAGPRLPLAPVEIDADPDGGYRVALGDRFNRSLDWGEMIALLVSLTLEPNGGQRIQMLTADEWAEWDRRSSERQAARQAESDRVVSFCLLKDDVKAFSDAISDVLCWAAGFSAANTDRGVYGPMGIEQLRTLNIKLKAALRPAEFKEVF